jgi:hypothetical protein
VNFTFDDGEGFHDADTNRLKESANARWYQVACCDLNATQLPR